ncbi:hypothetical protein [Actinomycetospora soli]|uniref:hypothetical protein n=1 Tax=Actinomycetospora soli TaxID=2893887 RepID=UPI001E5FAEFC|nr:hypothetical protein [Actinomycetospora soli]MCD2188023.1 hypothetical protein [Actinomycetospora soli]
MTDHAGAAHPFLRGPDVADRVARLLQGISSRASEIEADIAWATQTAGDEDTARRLGALLARWSATVGAYEQASMSLQLWASASAPGPDAAGSRVPDDTARTALAAVERLEATTLTPRVVGMREDAVAAAPLLDASTGTAGPRTVALGPGDRVFTLRAAGPYPGHVQDDVHRLADELVSQSRGALSLGLPDGGSVPVTVSVRPGAPADELDPVADHVVEGSITAPEGLLVLERVGAPALRVQVPIGVWRVRAAIARTDDATSWDLVLWRGRSLPDAVVLRQASGAGVRETAQATMRTSP